MNRYMALSVRTRRFLEGCLGIVVGLGAGLALSWHQGAFGAAPAVVKLGLAGICALFALCYLFQHCTQSGTRFERGKRHQ